MTGRARLSTAERQAVDLMAEIAATALRVVEAVWGDDPRAARIRLLAADPAMSANAIWTEVGGRRKDVLALVKSLRTAEAVGTAGTGKNAGPMLAAASRLGTDGYHHEEPHRGILGENAAATGDEAA